MNTTGSSFYVTLMSGNSLEYYPNNTLSKFTVQLPYSLNFQNNSGAEKDDWYVGLTRYVHTSINTNKNTIMFSAKAFGQLPYHLYDIIGYKPEFLKIVKEPNFLDCYDETKYFMDLDFKKTSLVQISRDGYAETLEHNYYGFQIPLMVKYTARELFDVIFSQTTKSKWDELKKHFKSFNLVVLHPDKDAEFIRSCLLDISPNYVCYYTDIIEPRIFGNKLSRALHMSPVMNDSEIVQKNAADLLNVEYCRIEKKNISEINILIADETGEQINFDAGVFNTLITLHFRKGI